VEHVIAVKEAVKELAQLCVPHTITIDDFMSVRTRGSVQYLGSTVAGIQSPNKDMRGVFEILFPSITLRLVNGSKPGLESFYTLTRRVPD
jgi:salicylate synthetase